MLHVLWVLWYMGLLNAENGGPERYGELPWRAPHFHLRAPGSEGACWKVHRPRQHLDWVHFRERCLFCERQPPPGGKWNEIPSSVVIKIK